MIPNYNEKRKRYYGIFALSHHEYLWEEFLDKGEDLRRACFVDEIDEALGHVDVFEDPDIRCLAVDALMEIINDHDLYNDEEAPYSLEHEDGSKLLLTYLGGAPLVTVCDSDWATYSSKCSPCCPQAGDLDTVPQEEWDLSRPVPSMTLCMSPEEMHEVAKENEQTYRIVKIDADGKETGEVWRANKHDCERMDFR